MHTALDYRDPDHVRTAVRAILWQTYNAEALPVIHVPAQSEPYNATGPDAMHHALPEIFFQLSGINQFTCDHQVIDQAPGEVCIMPAGVPHREIGYGADFSAFVLVHDIDRIIIHTMECTDGLRPWGFPTISYTISQGRQMAGLLSQTADAFIRKSDAAIHLLRAYLRLILDIYDTPSKERHYGYSPLVSQCIDLLFAEFSSVDLSLNSVARRLNCSANSLSARFSKEVGKTAIEYLSDLRIEQSKKLLKQSAMNVSEISHACGYNDPNYFSRLFKKQTGTTAKQYRRANQ